MSKHLGVSRSLELLEELRSAARDFTARGTRLNEELRLRLFRASHHSKAALEELAGSSASRLAEEESRFQAAISATKALYEKRKVRLESLSHSKEQALTKAENQTGQKYALQRQMLQAERDRDGPGERHRSRGIRPAFRRTRDARSARPAPNPLQDTGVGPASPNPRDDQPGALLLPTSFTAGRARPDLKSARRYGAAKEVLAATLQATSGLARGPGLRGRRV